MESVDRADSRADDGNVEARARFEAIAREILEPVRRFLARRTDPATADDVLADTLLVCWRRRDELPVETATSLQLEGAATTDRDTILRAVLRELTDVLADPAAARVDYRALCATVGRGVRLELPNGAVTGVASDIDDDGRLVVDGTAYAAGDVVHLRAAT